MSRSVIFEKRRWLLSPLLLFIFGCGLGRPAGLISRPPGTSNKLQSDLNSIQQDFVNPRCLSCHSEATSSNRDVSLRDISQIIEGQWTVNLMARRNLIKPGCPLQSFFYTIIKSGEMPPNESVDGESLRMIETWIVSLDPSASDNCSDEPGD